MSDETTKTVRVAVVGLSGSDHERLTSLLALASMGQVSVVDAVELAEIRNVERRLVSALEVDLIPLPPVPEKEWWRGGNPKRRRR